jgi:hypothetical protein
LGRDEREETKVEASEFHVDQNFVSLICVMSTEYLSKSWPSDLTEKYDPLNDTFCTVYIKTALIPCPMKEKKKFGNSSRLLEILQDFNR